MKINGKEVKIIQFQTVLSHSGRVDFEFGLGDDGVMYISQQHQCWQVYINDSFANGGE